MATETTLERQHMQVPCQPRSESALWDIKQRLHLLDQQPLLLTDV